MRKGSWRPKVIRHGRVVLDTPFFCMGYSLITKVEKEAFNRMKISHCIKFFTGFFQVFDHICRQVFSHQLCGTLSLGGCFRKVFGTIFKNSEQANASGTNSMTCFIYFVAFLHLLVFVKKNITWKIISLLAYKFISLKVFFFFLNFFLITLEKRVCTVA